MKGRRSWRWHLIRLELAAAIVAPVVVGALWLSAPNTMGGPMFQSPPDPLLGNAIIGLGIAMYLIGLAWMLSIYRRDPEGHRSSWRSHRHD
jgi:hypothetical protein